MLAKRVFDKAAAWKDLKEGFFSRPLYLVLSEF